MIDNAIYNILSNHAPLTAEVGLRMYPLKVPLHTSNPCVRWFTRWVDPAMHKAGASALDRRKIQIDVYADTKLECDTIAAIIRAALDRNIQGTYAGVVIDSIIYDTEEDSYEEEPNDFRNATDYIIRIAR